MRRGKARVFMYTWQPRAIRHRVGSIGKRNTSSMQPYMVIPHGGPMTACTPVAPSHHAQRQEETTLQIGP
jgi:hypothetical protein